MGISAQEAKVVCFGPFELDLRTSWLTRQGQPERLALQPSRLLALLVQRRGELVTREELRSELWPAATFVDFDHGLNNAVNRVREALRDSAISPRYIQTVPRRGYRFIAEVAAVETEPTVEAAPPDRMTAENGKAMPVAPVFAPEALASVQGGGAGTGRAIFSVRGLRWLAPAAVVMAIAVIGISLRSRRVQPAGPIRSLAVLPLQNLSGDAREEYFVDGMTDALITQLAHTADLRVVSRTSVMQDKGSKKSARQIAEELHVDAVVEGSVVRSGDRVRIHAELIDARNDRQLWAQSFDEPIRDVLTLQDRVVSEIAAQTQAALAPSLRESGEQRRVNPAAYDAYLRGLYFLHVREAAKSQAYFEQAISLDPSYPVSYAGLAEALAGAQILSTTPVADTESQAFAAARRAIALDPRSGEGYGALGFVEIIYRREWPAAGRDLERGLSLSPNNSIAELQYAMYLDAVGRPDDAVTQMRKALLLDPLSFTINRHLGTVLYFARQYQDALVYLHRADEMEPHQFRLVENWRSRTYEMLGRLDEAERSDLMLLSAWIPEAKLLPLRAAYGRGGWKDYQRARIGLLLREPQLACGAFEIAESYIRLGDRDRAFVWLDRGVETNCFWAYWLAVDPVLDGVRSDPRFAGLLRRAQAPPSKMIASLAPRGDPGEESTTASPGKREDR